MIKPSARALIRDKFMFASGDNSPMISGSSDKAPAISLRNTPALANWSTYLELLQRIASVRSGDRRP